MTKELRSVVADANVIWDIDDVTHAIREVVGDKAPIISDMLIVLEKAEQDKFFIRMRDTLTLAGNEMLKEYVEEVLEHEEEKET